MSGHHDDDGAGEDRRVHPAVRHLSIVCAALLVAHDGRVAHDELLRAAARYGWPTGTKRGRGGSRGTIAGRRLAVAMRRLRDDDLARKVEDHWVADDLADLAAWLADEVEIEHDGGQWPGREQDRAQDGQGEQLAS